MMQYLARTRSLVVVAIVLFSPALVRAEAQTKALDALVDAQIAAYFKGDEKALRATLAKDGQYSFAGLNPQNVVIPYPPENVENLKIVRRQTGWSGTWGWSVAEISLTSWWKRPPAPKDTKREAETWHWVTLAVVERGVVKARLIVADQAVPNDKITYSKWVDAMPAAASPPALAALLADPVTLTLAADSKIALIGAPPGELGFGPIGAKQMLDVWRKTAFQVLDTDVETDKSQYKPVEIAVADAQVAWAPMRWKLAGQTSWIKGTAILIGRKTKAGIEIVVLAYN